MRIRGLFTTCLACMALLVCLSGGFIALQDWTRWTAAEETHALMMLFEATAELNQGLALERGSYNELLASTGELDPAKLATAKANRNRSEKAGHRQLEALGKVPLSVRRQVETIVVENLKHLDQLREQTTEQLKHRDSERHVEAPSPFQRTMVGIVDQGSPWQV